MGLKSKSSELQAILLEMGEAFHHFQQQSELKCLPGCGKCCLYPDIESTALECLPLAMHYYEKGEIESLKAKLQATETSCALWAGDHATGLGKCTAYEVRPSICRIFGVAGYYDKNRNITLSICKLIKESSPQLAKDILQNRTSDNTPMISHWYSRIQSLGNPGTLQRLPINQAVLEAIELIEFYSQYE